MKVLQQKCVEAQQLSTSSVGSAGSIAFSNASRLYNFTNSWMVRNMNVTPSSSSSDKTQQSRGDDSLPSVAGVDLEDYLSNQLGLLTNNKEVKQRVSYHCLSFICLLIALQFMLIF